MIFLFEIVLIERSTVRCFVFYPRLTALRGTTINVGEFKGNAEMTDGLKRACVSFDRIYLEWSICVSRFVPLPILSAGNPRFLLFFFSSRIISNAQLTHVQLSIKWNRVPKAE